MQIDKNNWQIKIDEENREEVVDYFILKYTGKDYMREIGRVNFGGEFLSIHDYQIPFLTHYQDSNIPLITTDQFRKYILGKEEGASKRETIWDELIRQPERKIKCYAAPFDMKCYGIKKGDKFYFDRISQNKYIIDTNGYELFQFPSELVEAFFIPVYEEEEKVIELHGYKIMKGKILDRLNVDMKDIISGMWEYYNGIIKAYEELNK